MATAGQDLTYSGTEVICIIKEQLDCIDYTPVLDQGTDTNWYEVGYQGFLIVSSTFLTTDFLTFASLLTAYPLLVGYVADKESGELRYYDGNQATVADFIDPLFDGAIVQGANHDAVRHTDSIPGAGQVDPMDIKQKHATYDFTIEKLYSHRWKTDYTGNVPADVDADIHIPNPIGFMGALACFDKANVLQAKKDGHTPYFLVIFYARDSSNATKNIGTVDAYLCAKIESTGPKYTAEGMYTSSVKGKALGWLHFPSEKHQTITMDLAEQP